jgi:hypothetical protein
MEWEVIEAESGSAFITSDSPVSFYNPACFPPNEPGVGLAGTFVLFPLSSRHLLLMRHPECRTHSPLHLLPEPTAEGLELAITKGAIWSAEEVNNTNWKLTLLADSLIVGESKDILQRCIHDE